MLFRLSAAALLALASAQENGVRLGRRRRRHETGRCRRRRPKGVKGQVKEGGARAEGGEGQRAEVADVARVHEGEEGVREHADHGGEGNVEGLGSAGDCGFFTVVVVVAAGSRRLGRGVCHPDDRQAAGSLLLVGRIGSQSPVERQRRS